MMPELLQDNADDSRILRISLEQHDTDMVDIAYERISKRFGPQIAEHAVLSMVTKLMDTGWGFFNDETGEPSPLLNHKLPNQPK